MARTRMLPFRLVDAFAETPFEGNSAGVLLDADGLSDRQMQLIAREVNASETAFVAGLNDPDRPPRLRWLTPACEVDFCGHATLAAAHALGERLGLASLLERRDAAIEFQARPGALPLRPERLAREGQGADGGAEDVVWWLGMPPPTWERAAVNPEKLLGALRLTREELDPRLEIVRTREADLMLFVRSWQGLQELRPDLGALDALCRPLGLRGVFVSTVGGVSAAIHATSRFFAPMAGVPEDPVTGSAHGPLAALLVERGLAPRVGEVAALNCVQGIPGGRTGMIRTLVQGSRETGWQVLIGGRCQTTIVGEIAVPA